MGRRGGAEAPPYKAAAAGLKPRPTSGVRGAVNDTEFEKK